MIEETKMNAELSKARKQGVINTIGEAEAFKLGWQLATNSNKNHSDYIGNGISGQKIHQ